MTLLQITLLFGLVAALLMFCGDMLLYFNKNDYESDGTLGPIVDIMKRESRLRLYVGGIIGPVAAFLYCIGYFHLVLYMNQKYVIIGWICFLINCLGMICGGAYHSHCANLGLIGRHEDKEALGEVLSFLDAQKLFVFGFQGIGFLMMAVMVIMNMTLLPRWMIFFTPGILFLLTPILKKLPKGLHITLYGGWTNLISVIYYIAALLVVSA